MHMPTPLFEEPLKFISQGVFSRDYDICTICTTTSLQLGSTAVKRQFLSWATSLTIKPLCLASRLRVAVSWTICWLASVSIAGGFAVKWKSVNSLWWHKYLERLRWVKAHGSHCLNAQIHNWSNRHRNEARQWSLAVYSGFAMQLINHLIYASFLPQRTGIFRPQKYLAYACCMKPGCSEMIVCVSPHRAARNTSLLAPSLITDHLLSYWYHAY